MRDVPPPTAAISMGGGWSPVLAAGAIACVAIALVILIPTYPFAALGASGALLAVWIAARRALLAIAVILAVIALLGSESLLKMQLGIQWVEVDVLLLVTALGICARRFLQRSHVRPSRLDLAVIGFALAIALAAYIGLLRGADSSLVRSELRPPGYLVVVYAVVRSSVRDRRGVKIVFAVLLIATLLASLKALAIYLFVPAGAAGEPERVVLATRILNTGSKRVIIQGGEIFPALMILLTLPWFFNATSRRLAVSGSVALAILCFAVVISFTRSYWVGLVVGVGALMILLRGRFAWRLIRGIALSVMCTGLLITGLGMGLESFSAAAIGDQLRVRALSLLEGRGDTSIQSRLAELDAIGNEFTQAPLLGRGLGSTYQFTSAETQGLRDWEYTHNSYAYFLLKTGFVGTATLLFVILLGLATAFQLTMRSASKKGRLFLAGLSASLAALCVTSLFSPWLTHYVGAAYAGLALATVESMRVGRFNLSDSNRSETSKEESNG